MKKRMLFFNIIIPALAGIMIFIYIYYGRTGYIPSPEHELLNYGISIITGIIIGLSMLLIDKFSRKLWHKSINISRLITLQLTLKIITAFFILFLTTMLFSLLTNHSPLTIYTTYYDEIIKVTILTGGSMLFYSLISFALQSYNYYSYYSIERIRQERNQISLQFEALKSQLSPHYLFNCLNTISSLVHKNAQQSEDFIRRMAKTFQYVLNNDDKRLVKISEELEFVKAYNYLLKVRFEDQLSLSVDIPKDIQEGLIPPLTLQMLLENAVKHNLIDEKHHLKFYIYFEDENTLIIENNKTIEPSSRESFNIGLENIKRRYGHLCGKEIYINDGEKFCVKLPVIYKKSEVYE